MEDLRGQNGLFYLMFVGREISGKRVADELKNKDILADPEDQVYAAISFLQRNGYLSTVDRDGREKFRTANLEPIVESFQKWDILFNQDVVRRVGKYMDLFPEFVSRVKKDTAFSIRGLTWKFIFENFYWPYFDGIVGFAFLKQVSRKTKYQKIYPFKFILAALELHQEATRRHRESVKRIQGLTNKITKEDRVVFAQYVLQRVRHELEDYIEKIGTSQKKETIFQKLNSAISDSY